MYCVVFVVRVDCGGCGVSVYVGVVGVVDVCDVLVGVFVFCCVYV